jgi:hypothetical protein
MIAMFGRYLAYRRLKPIVTRLADRLANAFGPGDHYTVAQARRGISDLKLHKGVEPYVLAAACSLEDLLRAGVVVSAEHYHALRAELARLFDLRPDFSMRHLRTQRITEQGNGGGSSMAGM